MAEDTQDINPQGQITNPAENPNDLKNFLPFNGAPMDYPEHEEFRHEMVQPSLDRSRSSYYPIQENVTGFPPFKPGPVNKEGNSAASLSRKIYESSLALQDDNTYAKMHTYDASAAGAFKKRYKGYGQSTYDKIGFSPDVNNEALFNAKTSAWDDFKRMSVNAALPLLGYGFIAGPKSYIQAAQGNFGQDTDEADFYEEYAAIGNSTKGGFWGFTNNVVNSLAYTAGIMIEGAVEGSLMSKAIGAPGGAAAGAGAIGGGLEALLTKAGKLPSMLKNWQATSKSMLSKLGELQDINKARQLFNSAGRTVGNFINPLDNTFRGIDRYVLNNVDNLDDMARAARTFGSFYFDLRNANMALSEARLEGGFNENEAYKELYDKYYAEHGEAPSAELQQQYRETAKASGWQTTWENALLINYTNRLVMPNIMRGATNRMMPGATEIIKEFGPVDLVHSAKKGFEVAEVTLKNAGKSLLKPATYGKAGLTYFKANIMEGTQEVLQDVISEHTKKYYVDSFENPNRRNWDYSMGILKGAVKKQLSSQGFETFASGFVMGGAFSALDKVYKHLSVGYNQYYKNSANYDDYLKERTESAQELADELNEHYKDPLHFFNSKLFNYGAQGSIARAHDDEETTTKEDIDGKEASLRSALITMFQTGTDKYFVDQLKSFQYMSPKEIEDAMKLKEGEGEKALQRIDGILSKLKTMKASFEFMGKKMGSPINPNNFEKDSEEYKQAALFNSAWNAAKYNAVFLAQAFKDNLSRQVKMSTKLNSITQFKDLPVNAITPLLDLNKFDDETKMLKEEIDSMKGSTDPKVAKLRAKKQEQLDDLTEFGKKLESYYNHFINKNVITKEIAKIKKEQGLSDEEAAKVAFDQVGEELSAIGETVKGDLKESFVKYLSNLSGGSVDFLAMMNKAEESGSIQGLDDAFNQLLDYHSLEDENKHLTQYVNLLTDPTGFSEHVKRNFQWMSDMYSNRQDYVKDVINRAFEAKENDDLLKALADEGIYLDLDEFAEWVQDNTKLPTHFIDETNKKIIPQGSALYNDILEKFELASKLHAAKVAGEKTTMEEKLKQELAENEENRLKANEKARKEFDKSIKKETGKTEKELRDLEKEAMAPGKSDENQIKIKNLKKLQEKVNEGNLDEVETLPELLEDQDVISILNLQKAQVNLQDTQLESVLLPLIQERIKNEPDAVNSPERLIMSEAYKIIVNPILEAKIAELESTPQVVEPKVTRVEETQAWATYQTALEEIKAKYDGIANDLKAKYIKKGADVEENVETAVPSTSTRWDDLPEDLKAILTPLFDKYMESVGEISTDRLDEIRQNWLETQGAVIDKYNKGLEETFDETTIRLKYLPNKFPGDRSVTDLSVTELVALRNDLDESLATNRKPDPKDSKKTIPITSADKGTIAADIKTLSKYIEFRRSSFNLEAKFENALNIFKEKVQDRQGEITEIKDDDGNVVARTIAGKTPQRATKQAEEIELDMIPAKDPFIYSIIKPDEEGKPGEAVLLFNQIKDNENIPDEKKLDSFMSQFEKRFGVAKQGKKKQGQFVSSYKLEKLRELLEKSFTEESLISAIQRLAFEESTIAGNTIDVLTRDFFTLNEDKTGFIEISRPENMSEAAFNNLYGPRGIITEFRDRMIDGQFFVISNNVSVFDMNLLENGLAGAIDLLAINADGDFEIIDIKTSSEENWGKYNKDFTHKVKEGETLESIAKNKNTTVKRLKELNDFDKNPLTPGKMIYTEYPVNSKKYYFSLQQSIYSVLFNNMTGIMPKRLGLLPIEVEVTLNGFIKTAKKSSIVPKGESTIKLDYVPEIEDYGVVPIKPEEGGTGTEEKKEEPAAKPKRGRKPSAKQVKGTANSILNNVTIQEVPGVRTDVENRTDEYINKIESAKTAEEVKEYKADAHIAHTKEPLSVDIDTVSKIANARISELENSTAVNNVKVGEIIISKVPIFEEEVNTPFRIKVITEDKIEIESEETGFVIQINPEELETKFGKMTEETLNATPSNVTDIDLENAVRSGENVENVLDNPDELKQAAADAKGQDKKSIRSKLKDNSKKC